MCINVLFSFYFSFDYEICLFVCLFIILKINVDWIIFVCFIYILHPLDDDLKKDISAFKIKLSYCLWLNPSDYCLYHQYWIFIVLFLYFSFCFPEWLEINCFVLFFYYYFGFNNWKQYHDKYDYIIHNK